MTNYNEHIAQIGEESFNNLNKTIRQLLDKYYRYRDADTFFQIDQLLQICRSQGWTQEQIPLLIEMQNIIVLG